MKTNEMDILRKKFRASKYPTISNFVRETKSSLTIETYTSTLLRGGNPSLRSLLVMCVDLGCTNQEAAEALRARGEFVIARLVEPVEVSPAEKEILAAFRKLDDDKKSLVKGLLDSLKGVKDG